MLVAVPLANAGTESQSYTGLDGQVPVAARMRTIRPGTKPCVVAAGSTRNMTPEITSGTVECQFRSSKRFALQDTVLQR